MLSVAFGLLVSAQAAAADLTLQRVMLSSAGIGYFEYSADVDGPATLGLDVPLDQVDDVLASLVVFDSQGGVGTVELPGRDDSHAAFGDVPFTADTLQSVLDTLNALRGVEITVTGPRPMTGRIVHADSVAEPVPGTPTMAGTVPRTRVTLLSADGLRQFVLEDAESVQVADPALRSRIDRAIAAARGEAASSQRHLTLHSNGNGHRTVRVGYVAAAPLWKATYRLVLPAKTGDKARLQGWAVLENQTVADWHGVALTLQYGNPVTFRQALYRSYFVQRPEVPVEVLGRILPDVDTRAQPMVQAARGFAPGGAAKAAEFAATAGAPPPAAPLMAPVLAAPSDAAQTSDAAEETLFQIAAPLDLPAGHTASVPLLDRMLPAERLDVAVGNEPHPRAAVQITNDTGSSLPAGVLALYDLGSAAAFAGNARLGGLPPGEHRLLEFAQDLRTTVNRQASSPPAAFVALSAADGVLHVTLRQREVLRVTLTAPEADPRRVLVEIPRGGDQTLTLEGGPVAGTEETATAWRVPVPLAAHQTRTLVAYVDRLVRQDTVLLRSDDQVLLHLVNEQSLPEPARAALRQVLALRQEAAARRAALESLQKQRETVEQDEARVRQNLQSVGSGDALRARLLRALDADETRLEQLRDAIAQATTVAETAQRALADAVGRLKL